MSAFEFVFSLFGLLLGFSLVEVLSGFVRTLKARNPLDRNKSPDVKIGLLTPMLGIFVMLHLTGFWMEAWDLRDLIPAHHASLFVGLAIAGVYYFAASMIFPEQPEDWPNLDDYYFAHKRPILGGVLFCDLMTSLSSRYLEGRFAPQDTGVALAVAIAIVLFAVLARGRKTNIAILGVLLFIMLGSAFEP